MSDSNRRQYDACFNPFNEVNHKYKKRKSLRRVTRVMLNKLKLENINLSSHLKVCDNCRVKISKLPNPEKSVISEQSVPGTSSHNFPEFKPSESAESGDTNPSDDTDSLEKIEEETQMSILNKSLVSLGESPIKKRKLNQKRYPRQKLQNIKSTLEAKVFHIESDSTSGEKEDNIHGSSDIVKKLIDSYHATQDRNLKIQILTIFESWSYNEIKEHFQASTQMITVAKLLAAEKGILAMPEPKLGKRLETSIVEKVIEFYNSDDVSRIMAGKKNYVTVKENGNKIHKQKRLMLSNLRESYRFYKEQHPNFKVSFSKFAQLRPRQCILPGAHGTHTVCVCLYHENVKLMIDGANINKLSANSDLVLSNYNDCLAQIICNPPSPDCYLLLCAMCPGINKIIKYLEELFDAEYVEHITYKQWVTIDRTNLEILQSSVEDFLDKFSSKLLALLPHTFIAQQQSLFLKERKEQLEPGECIVSGDFSENYAFVIQNSVQGVHWNNRQATIHPFVIYYKDNDIVKHINYAAISECLKHDTIAVHLFQTDLIKLMKKEIADIKKIIYFSDGASAQYKNIKNFANLCFHEEDFGINAEWHFFATSHGKGPCDGIGGATKRLAAKASLQLSQDPITTPNKLFDWAQKNIKNINFSFFTQDQHKGHNELLNTRYEKAKPIRGTLKMHSVVPLSKTEVLVKQYSYENEGKLYRIIY